MTYQQTFQDMFDFYSKHREVLKDYTFIVSTNELENIDLYADFKNVNVIRDNIFTPFINSRVSIINDSIFQRILSTSDSRACVLKCVSFDTQTVSYIEEFFKKGTVSYKNFNGVIDIINSSNIGVDYIPYSIENLLFGLERKDSVMQTMYAFEMMCRENGKNEIVCRQNVQSIISLYENDKNDYHLFLKRYYQLVYVTLLKICSIQLGHTKDSLDDKMNMLVDFMSSKMHRMLHPELNLAKMYFNKGHTCGFFGGVYKKNRDIVKTIKNMAWDIFHLRKINDGASYYIDENADVLIPYFYTYDKRLNDIKLCYSVRASVVNDKTNEVFPFYYLDKNTVDSIKECSTFKKYLERSSVEVDMEALIAECENEIVLYSGNL